MPDLEFTGERVIPGLVDTNLYNEHFARYRFAAAFAAGKRVLDAGCGSGYGAAELSRQATFTAALDLSLDALTHAREHFPGPVHLQSRCEAFPFADSSFDLITAFEVIEHLEEWDKLLSEARRTLTASGIFLVSTPNKSYYAETREATGPNPFHAHEFEFQEFKDALQRHFQHVQILLQNHTEAVTFSPGGTPRGLLETNPDAAPEEAHFYLALCSRAPLPALTPFAWVPDASNVLRTREHHIALLQGEVKQKTFWLDELRGNHAHLQTEHEQVLAELRKVNHWSAELATQLDEAKAWGKGLEEDLAAARDIVAARDAELALRNAWVEQLKAEVAQRLDIIAKWTAKHEALQEEFAAAQAEAAAAVKRLEDELAAVRVQALASLEEARQEAAAAANGYELVVAALERDIAGLHAGYASRITLLESEKQNIAAGYENVIAGLEEEKARIHSVYQAVIEALKVQLEEVHAERDAALLSLEQTREVLRTASLAKWMKLGRSLHLGPNLESH